MLAELHRESASIGLGSASATALAERHIPVGLVPSPFPTSPFSLRSICQLSVSPALFFNVNANTAFPCLIASCRSASEDVRAALIASKASEEGKESASRVSKCSALSIVDETDRS